MGWSDVNRDWRPLPHLPIEELSSNLWRVQGTLPGMGLKRVMTVVRQSDGGLVIHSAIALDDASISRLEAWGTPAWLIVPNGLHRLDAPAFRVRYPDLKVLCPEGMRAKVSQAVAVDGSLDDFPEDDELRLERLAGVGNREGVMVVSSDDGVTLVFNDLIFNQPHGRGLGGLFFRYVTASTGGPCISRMVRTFMIRDRKALRANLERLADLPRLVRIIVSHHRTITLDPAATLRQVATTL